MSTCPEKDIHSLYLDGELPSAYIAEYEAHIASCPNCKAQLDRLKALHTLFAKDAQAHTPSQAQIDASFERLQTKLSYSKTLSLSKKSSFSDNVVKLRNSSRFTGALAGAAAAAAVMLIFPVRSAKQQPVQTTNFAPVARTQIQSPAELTTSMSPLLTSDTSVATPVNASDIPAANLGNTQIIFVDQTEGLGSTQAVRESLASYDVFAPVVTVEQPQVQETISGFTFTVTVPLGNIVVKMGSEN
ncbi:MAG TPA: hypothetical protein DCQ43_03385 [Treponema sp.]|nr:hypothetical protein [Treponema sp.]